MKLADPLGSAKYVVFTTVEEPKSMPGLDSPLFPWPYIEGVTMAEAMNDLAFVSVGLYGKPLPKQNGAPIRITLPWKYGFKSAKALREGGVHRQAAENVLGSRSPPTNTASGPT